MPVMASSFFEKLSIARFRRRDHGIIEGAIGTDRAWLVLARKIPRQACDQTLGLVRIGHEHLDNVLHGDGLMVGMPAIEIGRHGDRRVTNFRFAGEPGFRHAGHADHGVTEIFIGEALGESGELRPRFVKLAQRSRRNCPFKVMAWLYRPP